MEKRLFYSSLFYSSFFHILAISFLSLPSLQPVPAQGKSLEVNYVQMQVKPTENKKTPIGDFDQPKEIKMTYKQGLFESQRDIRDISKLSETFRPDKEQINKFKPAQAGREIIIPELISGEITDPEYLTYNQLIRQKIKQRAYRYVNDPHFDRGDVYLTFVLLSNGMLKQVKIIDEKTYASEFLKKMALSSVKEADPFPPFPKDLNCPELTISVPISFRVE